MTKKTYLAKTPIEHNGEKFAEGDPIELDDKTEAVPLLGVGAVELAPPKTKTEAK